MLPYSKTGGLADVMSALPIQIRNLGNDVSVFLPRYKTIDKNNLEVVIDRLEVPLGSDKETGRIYKTALPSGVVIYFVDHPEFFCRDAYYGTPLGDYPDNDRRFTFFQRAVLECLESLKEKPDIIHCHDWQSGLVPVYLKTLYADRPLFKRTKSVFTIHNLAYQGNFPPDSLPATGLSWDHFRMEKLEFYGKVSFLKGGLVYSDVLTTVSERYAQEIQTKEFGCGLEGVLIRRRDTIAGIINGIDYDEWNPETDKDITQTYGVQKIAKKAVNKAILQKENDFAVDLKTPLIGIVTRLVDQKGIDILIPALGELSKLGVQFVLLGTGDEKYHQVFRDIAKKNRSQFGIHILFDSIMAKRIYAGADMMLFPSYYEPCGLGHMIALRFGTVPVVRLTGGLADTVHEFQQEVGTGNGFVFSDYTGAALVAAVRRALDIYRNEKLWTALVKNAMECDFSWTASAKKYVQLYEQAVHNKSRSV